MSQLQVLEVPHPSSYKGGLLRSSVSQPLHPDFRSPEWRHHSKICHPEGPDFFFRATFWRVGSRSRRISSPTLSQIRSHVPAQSTQNCHPERSEGSGFSFLFEFQLGVKTNLPHLQLFHRLQHHMPHNRQTLRAYLIHRVLRRMPITRRIR
jgi:hypothetical protein